MSTRAPDVVVDRREAVVVANTEARLHWGPIVAGFLAALGLFVLSSLLAMAIGASTVSADDTAPATVAAVVAGVIALFSFFAGGFVAAWSDRMHDEVLGAVAGFLVWALSLVLMLAAGGLGLGQLFGAGGALLSDMTAPDLTRQQIVDLLQSGSWRAFLAMALAAASAALGGATGAWMAGRRTTTEVA